MKRLCFSSLCGSFIVFVFGLFPSSSVGDYRTVTGPCAFVFPRDHGPHPDFRTEWWYYTGNLDGPSGKRYGFQLTFFRSQLAEPGSEKTWPKNPSAWRTKDLFLAHSALSDSETKRFYLDERMARSGAGLSGVTRDNDATRVFIGNWSAIIESDTHRLKAPTRGFSIDLVSKATKPLTAHGIEGYSLKGKRPESASCYYSYTRLQTEGWITLSGKPVPVRGTAWMDHEFSSAPLEDGLAGWDWFSLQLGDGRELMIYQLRRGDGTRDPRSSGTLIDSQGRASHLAVSDFTLAPAGQTFRAPSGAVYPISWTITVPSQQLELRVSTPLQNQELVTTGAGVAYWEGLVDVAGTARGASIQGRGYLEMTGYKGSLGRVMTQ